jgi:hypothetical protein
VSVGDLCIRLCVTSSQDVAQATVSDISRDLTIDRTINMEAVVRLVLMVVTLFTYTVANWLIHVNENHNFKAICFKFLDKVFEINHHLLVGNYVNPSHLISVLGPILLLKCCCITRVNIVNNAVYCDDCNFFIALAKTDINPTPVSGHVFS